MIIKPADFSTGFTIKLLNYQNYATFSGTSNT